MVNYVEKGQDVRVTAVVRNKELPLRTQIWSGDLNALPDMNPADSPYRIMVSYMRDALLDVHGNTHTSLESTCFLMNRYTPLSRTQVPWHGQGLCCPARNIYI